MTALLLTALLWQAGLPAGALPAQTGPGTAPPQQPAPVSPPFQPEVSDPLLEPAETDVPEAGEPGIIDVHSSSEAISLDGTPYVEW